MENHEMEIVEQLMRLDKPSQETLQPDAGTSSNPPHTVYTEIEGRSILPEIGKSDQFSHSYLQLQNYPEVYHQDTTYITEIGNNIKTEAPSPITVDNDYVGTQTSVYNYSSFSPLKTSAYSSPDGFDVSDTMSSTSLALADRFFFRNDINNFAPIELAPVPDIIFPNKFETFIENDQNYVYASELPEKNICDISSYVPHSAINSSNSEFSESKIKQEVDSDQSSTHLLSRNSTWQSQEMLNNFNGVSSHSENDKFQQQLSNEMASYFSHLSYGTNEFSNSPNELQILKIGELHHSEESTQNRSFNLPPYGAYQNSLMPFENFNEPAFVPHRPFLSPAENHQQWIHNNHHNQFPEGALIQQQPLLSREDNNNLTQTDKKKLSLKKKTSIKAEKKETNKLNSKRLEFIDSEDGSQSAEKLVTCEECDKTFSKNCYLTQHIKSFHSGEKPFKCDQCGKRFTVEKLLSDHMQKHAGEKPYKCDVCPKQFNHKTDLRRHKCLHSGDRPYACENCGKGFIRKDHCVKHFKTHKKKPVNELKVIVETQ